jgi:CBS domain-containing protein
MTKKIAAVSPQDTLRKAAQLMDAENVGCVLVLDANRKPVGLVTDRDLVIRGMAAGRSAEGTPVEAVMTRSPHTTRATEPVMLVARRMADLLVRRLPVVDQEGRAVGLISVDDLAAVFITELSNVVTAIAGTSKLLG